MTPQYWDSTMIRALKTCPRKFELGYRQSWRANNLSEHLVFGGAFAKALEEYYTGTSLENVIARAFRTPLQQDSPKNVAALIRSIIWYIEEYANDKPFLVNGKPAVEQHFLWEAAPDIFFTGHMDRVIMLGDDPYVVDQKTTGKPISPYFFRQYEHQDQMYMYSLIAKEVLGCPVRGVVIDAVQVTDKGETNFGRKLVSFSKPELDEWLADTLDWIMRMSTSTARNLTQCPNCDFRIVCDAPPAARQGYLKAFYHTREWKPEIPRGESDAVASATKTSLPD